jgi:hypothetical protein
MDPLRLSYFRVNSEAVQVKQYTDKAEKANTPELKQAYETIKAIHVSTLTSLQQNLILNMSTLVGEMKPTEQK